MAISRKRKKAAARKPARGAHRAEKPSARRRARRTTTAPRADFGAPVDPFFAKQPPHLRAVLEALRKLVEEAAPEATGSIKWGMPFYAVEGEMMCALTAHKSHVNLILPGPPGTYADPGGLLEGEGKTGKHFTIRALEELPREAVRRWLRTASERARASAE